MAQTQQQSGIMRTDLQQQDLSDPKRELVQSRVDIPPGAVSPSHTHPGEEIVYVIEGSLDYQLEGMPWVRVEAGDVLFIPAGVVHTVRNESTGNGAELATYVVEKGEPLFAPA
jgi:quercetin dioxygenase-like cupin family protein